MCCFIKPLLMSNFAGPLVALSPSSYTSHVFLDPTATPPEPAEATGEFSILCWNLLAPPYRRVAGGRESEGEGWRTRVAAQIDYVARADADVVALQEFWSGNRQSFAMWKKFAARHRYSMFISPRTCNKADGCCLLFRQRGASGDPGSG